MLIAGSIATFMALAYIPISKLRCIYCVKLREISYQSHCMRGGGGGAYMLFFWLVFIRDGETVVFLIYSNHSHSPPPYLLHALPVIRESRTGLPFTISPEYQAAQRAYMRYHNMNPIFGISSR